MKIFATMLLTLVAAAPSPAQDWPMLGHDPQRTNCGPLAVEPPYKITWAWPGRAQRGQAAALSPFAQPVIATVPTQPMTLESADGEREPAMQTRVFIGTMRGEVWALDAATGAKAWQSTVGGPVMNSPAVAAGRVFVAGGGSVTAFDVADGVRLWRRDLGAPLMCSPLPVGDRVFIAGRDGRAYAINAATGAELWSTPLDAPAAGSCAWADGKVLLATHAATAYALNDRDGEILWRQRLRGQDPWYYPVIAGKAVMFRTRSAIHGPSDDGVEKVLRALPKTTDAWPPSDWLLERAAIASHLEQPDEQSFFVFNLASGEPLFTPAITRVGGGDCPPWPVVSPTGLVFAHRRVRSTRMKGAMNMGSRYPLDFDQLGIEAGDRKPLAALPLNDAVSPRVKLFDMNRTHYATAGGHMIYFYHAEAGCFALDLKTGEARGIVRPRPTATLVPDGTQTLREGLATDGGAGFAADRLKGIASGAVPAAGALFINLPTVGYVVRIDGNGGKDAPTPADVAQPVEPAASPVLRDEPPLPRRVSPSLAVSEVLVPGAVPPAAEPLRKMLVEQVREIIRAKPLAPAYYLAGEKHATYLFDSPGDIVWAVCEAMPFLPGDMRPRVTEYLRKYMAAHPPWEDAPLEADAGEPREYFPITPENRLAVSSISRLREAKLRRLYALWLYAEHTGDAGYIRENWPAIAEFAQKGLDQVERFGPTYADLTGLIGLARLAILTDQDAIAADVTKEIGRLSEKLSDIETFRQEFDERNRLIVAPNFVRVKDRPAAMGMLLADLAPATMRLLDAEALAKHCAEVDASLPHWFIGLGGPTYGEDVWAGARTMPPHVPAGYFQLHAWLGQTPPEQLARWVDAPYVRVGDCFYIRKLSAALTRYASTEYRSLAQPTKNP